MPSSDNDKQYIDQLKKDQPWLASFDLSDDEFYNLVVYSTRIILGKEALSDFLSYLSGNIKNKDTETIHKIALEIAMHRFWKSRKYINGDVREFITSLGGTPPKVKKKIKKKEASEKTPTDYLVKAEENVPVNGSKAMTFSTMDEEEVKKIAVPEVETYKLDYDTLADDIISKFGYNESDEILHKRLSNIIISRFRDVRDEIESIDALTKSHKVGGMEFTKDQAGELLKLIKEEQKEFKEYNISSGDGIQRIEFKSKVPQFSKPEAKVKTLLEKRAEELGNQANNATASSPVSIEPVEVTQPVAPVLPKIENIPVAPKQPEVTKIENKDKTKEENGLAPVMDEEDGLPILRMPEDLMVKPEIVKIGGIEEKKEEIKKPISMEVPSVQPVPAPLVKLDDNNLNEFIEEKTIPVNFVQPIAKKEEVNPLPQPAPYVVQKSIPQRVIESQNTRRPIVDGIKLAKKLTGPIEELSEMTLIDFRRLASTPIEATKSIKAKINLLQEESYGRRIEGINAWFSNEVNRFYRLLGQTSMSEGKSIDDIIKERLVSGKPTLSFEEFDAVMQLNSELRY